MSGEETESTSISVRTRWAVAGLLALHAALLAVPSWRYGPRIDEVGHMAAGLSHWQTGDFTLYVVNPPLVRLLATAGPYAVGWELREASWSPHASARAEFRLGKEFATANSGEAIDAWRVARLFLIPLSLLGAFVTFLWARKLGGDVAGLSALAVWTVSPDMLATGSSICPDMGAAAFGLLCLYAFRGWLLRPTWAEAAAFGLAAGLAELTKFTWVTLYAALPAVWIVCRLADRRRGRTVR